MKKISANTLQEALSQAALELGCSVMELEYEVVQYESKGFLGLGKKQAIIIANKTAHNKSPNATSNPKSSNQHASQHDSQDYAQIPQSAPYSPHTEPESTLESSDFSDGGEFFDASEFIKEDKRQERFQTKDEIAQEIREQIKELLDYMPYKIDKVEVSFYDPQTIYIYIDGQDSALLIGERGYRYKAFSYLLFNWIQPTYGYGIRLEIAQFLQNQESAIDSYLVGIINEVHREGKAQTKPLDGILAFIALKKLREQFPDKYISFRDNPQGEKYIIINEFYRYNS